MAGSKLVKAVDRITSFLDRTTSHRVHHYTNAREFLATIREVAQEEYNRRHPTPPVSEEPTPQTQPEPQGRRRRHG